MNLKKIIDQIKEELNVTNQENSENAKLSEAIKLLSSKIDNMNNSILKILKLFDLCKNSIIQYPNYEILKERLFHLQQIHEESKEISIKIGKLFAGFSSNDKMLKENIIENEKVKEIFVKQISSMNSNIDNLVLKIENI